jgi:hypothetical protein
MGAGSAGKWVTPGSILITCAEFDLTSVAAFMAA